MIPTIRPDQPTLLFDVDPDDSSDGVPTVDDDVDLSMTPRPSNIVAIDDPEPTRRLAPLTLRQKFAILWALEGPAKAAGVQLSVDPMPEHEPTAVHLWARDWPALCRWLRAERERDFCTVPIERMFHDDLEIEAARHLLRSLADGIPLMRNKVMNVGPESFVLWSLRGDEQ